MNHTASVTHELSYATSADVRPGCFDWEVLADADAEFHDWLDARHEEALAAIDAFAPASNDNHVTAA